MQHQPLKNRNKRTLQEDLKFYYELLSQIVLSLLIPVMLGYWADQFFNMSFMLTGTGILVGLAASFFSGKRIIKKWLEPEQHHD